MKAITIWQPYASLFPRGLKHYETRSWSTKHRGKIAIHAGTKPMRWILKHGDEKALEIAARTFGSEAIAELPVGKVVAVADLVDVIKMTPEFIAQQTETERAVGDWQPGRYAWKLENIRILESPISATGKQGLWEWSVEPERNKQTKRCVFCDGEIPQGAGHNPAPLRKDGECCLGCNLSIVVPERIKISKK